MSHSRPPWGGLKGRGRETEQSGAEETESALMEIVNPSILNYHVQRGMDTVGRFGRVILSEVVQRWGWSYQLQF